MTTINANNKPLGEIILGSPTLWSLINENHNVSYHPVVNQLIAPDAGNQLGTKSYNLETVYKPEPKSLTEIASAKDFSGLLLYVGTENPSRFGYKGSNETGDGDIVLFYDASQQFIKAEFSPLPTTGPDNRLHFTGSFSIDSNVRFILFGGLLGTLNIEEITLE